MFKLPRFARYASKINLIHHYKCHSVFGIKDIIKPQKQENFTIYQVQNENHKMAVDMIKQHYLSEHILVRARNLNLNDDRSIDEYLVTLIKQGNSLYAKAEDGTIAGVCINYAASPVDPKNLRNYAFYRQDPNTKDFLYFTAKLQETPNLWNVFKQPKVFEVKMLTVLPEFRRMGLAVMLTEKSMAQAKDQGYKVIRMDCINSFDYKVAERCMLSCLVRFPLHKLRGTNAPFIKRNSEHNQCVRVYVDARAQKDSPDTVLKPRETEIESMFE